MNLLEAIHHRDDCVICGKPMKIKLINSTYRNKLTINVTDEGLKIRSGHKDGVYLNFKFDGSYERNKRNYKIYTSPVFIEKMCNLHPHGSEQPIIRKVRSPVTVGSTIDNLKELSCHFSFTLFGDSSGQYDVSLHTEKIHYFNHEEFWHVNVWYNSDHTAIHNAKFDDKLEKMLTLRLPAVDLKNVKNIEQLIDKVKLYTLFS